MLLWHFPYPPILPCFHKRRILKPVFHGASFHVSKIGKGPKMAKLPCVKPFEYFSSKKYEKKALTALRDVLKSLKQLVFGHFSSDFRFLTDSEFPWSMVILGCLIRANRRREKRIASFVCRVNFVKNDPRKMFVLLLSLDFRSDFKFLTP